MFEEGLNFNYGDKNLKTNQYCWLQKGQKGRVFL